MNHALRRRRSALFVPAANARALKKAPSTEADVLIFDLEDAVAPAQKAAARANLAEAWGRETAAETVIRINGGDTEWVAEDVALAARLGPAAILVPKVRRLADLRRISDMIGPEGSGVELWAMVEEPMAFFHLPEICEGGRQLPHPLSCLAIGSNDLGLQTNVGKRQYMVPWFMQAVLAAKAWDLGILDGVRNDFVDVGALQTECEEGASMGFGGKTLIHPSQVPIANTSFSPTAEAVDWAKKVVAAFSDDMSQGVIAVDGVMVEHLHLAQAKRILLMAR